MECKGLKRMNVDNIDVDGADTFVMDSFDMGTLKEIFMNVDCEDVDCLNWVTLKISIWIGNLFGG